VNKSTRGYDFMRTDIEEKVLEKLATSDKATIVIERQPDGKMRVTSGSWDGEKVFSRDQVLEVRCVDGRLHVDDENDVEVETGWPSWCQNYGSPECAHHR
jgi:hypothetical protein